MSQLEFEVVCVNEEGEIVKRQKHSAPHYPEKLAENVYLDLVVIPEGDFLMGSPESEEGYLRSQSPQHSVHISPFWMSVYPITQAQWKKVAKLPPIDCYLAPTPANFVEPNRPVEQVSWEDAKEFCARLSQLTGKTYQLPSEAQWEYACRANATTPFHFGQTLSTDLANYSGVDWEYLGKVCSRGGYGKGKTGEDRRETTPIDYFSVKNAFGLSDMHGNVREWCADPWHLNYQNAPNHDRPWLDGGHPSKRILRGGSWNGGPHKCRSAYRGKLEADGSLYDIGFRVVGLFNL